MEEKWEISIAFDGNVNLIQLFSHQVVSDHPQPHELHTRLTCSSLSPRVCSDSCPLSQWCHSAILSSLTPFSSVLDLSQHQGLFQWIGSSIRWPKYWSFSFSISPSNEYWGLISFGISIWFDLLSVHGTLKSLPQHHSLKASVLHNSAFFLVQLPYSYMTAGKTTALTVVLTG